jgi:cytochrome P450
MVGDTPLPPGPHGLPIIGNLLQLRRDPLAFVRRVQLEYGNVATVRLLGRPIVLFFRPEAVQFFLVDHARSFISGSGRAEMRRLLGEGLLTTDGEVHRRQRRQVQPAFHKRRVEGYAAIMVEQTQQMLAHWRSGTQVDVARELQELTLRIVVKALFNVDLQDQSSALSQAFTDAIESRRPLFLPQLKVDLPFTAYHRFLAARRTLDAFVYRLIAKRRTDGRDVGDVLSMLLQADDDGGLPMTDEQVRDQAMTLIAAGHETTSNALTWTLYLLSEHPRPREKLLAELQTVLGGRPPALEDLPKLPYLDWVLNESMRIYPPAWTIGRRASEPFALEGYHFPAGTRVLFSQWVIHHLPEVWGDPDDFRPERWDPATGRKPPPGAYFPFGGGPRMCIGMPFAQLEMRLLLATILQHTAPSLVPGWPVVPMPRVTLRLKHGLRMILDPAPSAEPVARSLEVVQG